MTPNLTDFIKNRANLGKVVLVTGDFNVLHPGHIRLLRFAKECGNTLVVSINSDESLTQDNYNDEQHRFDVVASLSFVDYCFINQLTIEAIIREIKPDTMVKGREHESQFNPEKKVLAEIGSKLIFSSGDTFQKSSSVFQASLSSPLLNVGKVKEFTDRHAVSRATITRVMASFESLNVLVIGDTIVDEYMQCNAVGMSQEDPTIVVTPDEHKMFLGGAGITAAHAKSLGANKVSFFTVLGEDETADFAEQKLQEYQLNARVFKDDTRPTTKKRRYRVGNKTLLRVNEFREHDISTDIQDAIFNQFKVEIKQTNLVVFSDFNYGILPQPLVEKIVSFCNENNIMVAADSQTSSQVGDISRFNNVDIVTPTEREVRVALNNTQDGLVTLTEKLQRKMQCNNVIVTLADEGVLLHRTSPNDANLWENDKIPALANNVQDPAGAGDCLLASSAMALASGSDLWTASLIGSVAAACQVSRVGNQPIEHQELRNAVMQLL